MSTESNGLFILVISDKVTIKFPYNPYIDLQLFNNLISVTKECVFEKQLSLISSWILLPVGKETSWGLRVVCIQPSLPNDSLNDYN